MEEFFVAQDLVPLDFIPKDKIPMVLKELNRVVKMKIAGSDETKWTEFLNTRTIAANKTQNTGARIQ